MLERLARYIKLNELRKELEEATKGIPSKHPNKIASLAKIYPHSIVLRSNPYMVDFKIDCFIFVFQENIPTKIIDKLYDFLGNTNDKFLIFKKLMDNGFMEIHNNRKDDDKIIVYFDRDKVTHFGKLENDKIVSKWGTVHIWEHPVFEVPLSYGNIIKYSNGLIDIKVLENIINKV